MSRATQRGEKVRALTWATLLVATVVVVVTMAVPLAHGLRSGWRMAAARDALSQGSTAVAARSAPAVLLDDPAREDARRLLEEALSDSRSHDAALRELDRVLQDDPRNVTALELKAQTLLRLERPEDALAAFERLAVISPRSSNAQFQHGSTLAQLGRREFATEAFSRALALAPDVGGMHRRIGHSWRESGAPKLAVKNFSDAVLIDPRCPESHYGRGKAWSDLREFDRARTDFRAALRLGSDELETELDLANCDILESKFADALKGYQALATRFPRDARLWNNTGYAHQRMGDHPAAVRALTTAVRLDPKNPRAWRHLATSLRRLGDPSGALRNLDRAVALRPRWADALADRAAVRLDLGDHEEALADADLALGLDPTNAALARAVRATVWAEASRWENVVSELDRLLATRPELNHSRLLRARARLNTGDLSGALGDVDAVLAHGILPEEATSLRARILKALRGAPDAAPTPDAIDPIPHRQR